MLKENLTNGAESANGIVSIRHIGFALFAVALLALPWILVTTTGSQFWVEILSEVFVFGIVVMSYDLIFGFAGVISFGHALMFGGATYLIAILTSTLGVGFFVSILVALTLVTLFSAFLASVALYRLGGGVYFAIVTLATAQLGYSLVLASTGITGGDNGIFVSVPKIAGVDPTNTMFAYYLLLMALVAMYIALRRVVNSPFGRVIQGIRDNEERMETIGVNVYRYKVISFTLSGLVAGIAGVFYLVFSTFISPSILFWQTTGDILMMSLVGGFGSLWGPIFGAAMFILSKNILSEITGQWLLFFGLLFVIFILYAPEGIAGIVEERTGEGSVWRRLKESLRRD